MSCVRSHAISTQRGPFHASPLMFASREYARHAPSCSLDRPVPTKFSVLFLSTRTRLKEANRCQQSKTPNFPISRLHRSRSLSRGPHSSNFRSLTLMTGNHDLTGTEPVRTSLARVLALSGELGTARLRLHSYLNHSSSLSAVVPGQRPPCSPSEQTHEAREAKYKNVACAVSRRQMYVSLGSNV